MFSLSPVSSHKRAAERLQRGNPDRRETAIPGKLAMESVDAKEVPRVGESS